MPDNDDIIRRGRACVRLLEAIDALLEKERQQEQREVLQAARQLAIRRPHQIVRDSDLPITAQIMLASHKRLGAEKDVTLN